MLERPRCRGSRRRWRSNHASIYEMCDEPSDAALPAALSLGRPQCGNRVLQFREYRLVDFFGIETAFGDLLAEQTVNGGGNMYRGGGAKMYHGLGGSLSA